MTPPARAPDRPARCCGVLPGRKYRARNRGQDAEEEGHAGAGPDRGRGGRAGLVEGGAAVGAAAGGTDRGSRVDAVTAWDIPVTYGWTPMPDGTDLEGAARRMLGGVLAEVAGTGAGADPWRCRRLVVPPASASVRGQHRHSPWRRRGQRRPDPHSPTSRPRPNAASSAVSWASSSAAARARGRPCRTVRPEIAMRYGTRPIHGDGKRIEASLCALSGWPGCPVPARRRAFWPFRVAVCGVRAGR